MDDEDFKAWKICWKANIFFHKLITEDLKCIVCDKVGGEVTAPAAWRSFFWIEAMTCSAGHRQATRVELEEKPTLGVCGTCDQRYLFDVIKGKHRCRREGCQRTTRIREPEVRQRLASDTALSEEFLAVVRKFRVYECAIHCDDVEYDENPFVAYKPPTTDCNHDRNVCDACLKAALESAIRGGRLQDLICPDVECKKPITLEAIRPIISGEVFKIYNKQLALKTISQDRKFRWCSCGHGQIHEPGESNPEWICLSCKKQRCYICKEESSEPCEHLRVINTKRMRKKNVQRESALRLFTRASQEARAARQRAIENEAGTKREIARTTKKCPKAGCSNRIERNEGCGHFKCSMCKTEFCWACKVIWPAGKALHLRGCRIGTKSTIAKEHLNQTGYAVGWNKDDGYDFALDAGLWLITTQL